MSPLVRSKRGMRKMNQNQRNQEKAVLMNMSSKAASMNTKLCLGLCVVFLLLHLCAETAGAGSIQAVFAFGDSILDTGNNNLLATSSRCNFPPYGRDLPPGIPTGRFGNGRVFSDLLTAGLGIKELLPAFRSPDTRDENLPTGVCFASGGSGLDPATNAAQNVLSLDDQLNDFKSCTSKLQGLVGPEKASSIISNSLFLISSGNNDFGIGHNGFILNPVPSYITELVGRAANFVQELYNLGARRVAFMTTIPFGCVPEARGALPQCNQFADSAAEAFNSQLGSMISDLNERIPGSNMFLLDIYSPLLNIANNPQANGFLVANAACYNIGGAACPNADDYVFWDFLHPSQKTYNLTVQQVLQKYAQNLA